MKKYYFVLFLFFSLVGLVMAQGGGTPIGGGGFTPTIENPLNVDSIEGLISKIFDLIIYLGTPFLVMMIIYTGYTFVVARGNEGMLRTAKNNLKWTLIGIAVIFGAWAITEALKNTVEQLGGNTSFHYERLLYYNYS